MNSGDAYARPQVVTGAGAKNGLPASTTLLKWIIEERPGIHGAALAHCTLAA
jgi:hypothetical protein